MADVTARMWIRNTSLRVFFVLCLIVEIPYFNNCPWGRNVFQIQQNYS